MQQLQLLPEPELADCAVSDRADPVVRVPRCAFELVLPFAAQVGDGTLIPRFGIRLRLCSGFLEIHLELLTAVRSRPA